MFEDDEEEEDEEEEVDLDEEGELTGVGEPGPQDIENGSNITC